MKRTAYHREWSQRHPGYKAADSRRRALFRPAGRAFYREILGVRVRVNLLAWLLRGILLALMLCPPANAQPKKVFVVGGCYADARNAVKQFQDFPDSPPFDLYVVCREADWRDFMRKCSLSTATVAMSDWKRGIIWLGPRALEDAIKMRDAIVHELEHLHCKCSLGEHAH